MQPEGRQGREFRREIRRSDRVPKISEEPAACRLRGARIVRTLPKASRQNNGPKGLTAPAKPVPPERSDSRHPAGSSGRPWLRRVRQGGCRCCWQHPGHENPPRRPEGAAQDPDTPKSSRAGDTTPPAPHPTSTSTSRGRSKSCTRSGCSPLTWCGATSTGAPIRRNRRHGTRSTSTPATSCRAGSATSISSLGSPARVSRRRPMGISSPPERS